MRRMFGCRATVAMPYKWCGDLSSEEDSEVEDDIEQGEGDKSEGNFRNVTGCYIMTLGVIDEVRRFGLGSMLLAATEDILREQWPNCIALYLHVVDYNQGAIKFYQRNGFQ